MDRVTHLIRTLNLAPHPEGGAFCEVFRSHQGVVAPDGARRAAVTAIYFLLTEGQKSRWHRVAHDEIWHFCEGDPLELLLLHPELDRVERHMLGPLDGSAAPLVPIPGGSWQAARPTGGYTLVACTVAPGFEYRDFALMGDQPDVATKLLSRFPDLGELL